MKDLTNKMSFLGVESVFSVKLWVAVILGGLLIRYIRFKMKYNLPPRPYGWPIIGNMLALDTKTSLARWMQKVARDHGPIFRLSFGIHDVVVVNDMYHAHEAMVERGKDFAGRAEGMLFQERSENYQDIGFADPEGNWIQRRKILAVALRNFTSGKAYEARVHEAFRKLMKHLDAKADNEESFDPKDYCKFFVYNQIAAMCFGTSYEFDDEVFVKLVEDTETYNRLFESIQLSDILEFSKYLPFDLPDRRKAKKILKYTYEYFAKNLDEHRENLMTRKEISDLTYCVMKMIAEDGNPAKITAVQERQIIIDVFTAGIDTTQMQFRWVLACLAEYQDIQEKIYDEIMDTMGPIDKGDDNLGVSSSDYKANMPYSEAFILETTRFGTVAVICLPRKTLNDTKIGDYDIPKGTQVLFNQYAINYDENENEEPYEFRPERFLTEDGFLGPRPSSYMPFGLGRRSCPGEGASRNTLWMTMIMLLRRYQVLPGRNFQLKYKDKFIVAEPVDYEIVLRYRS